MRRSRRNGQSVDGFEIDFVHEDLLFFDAGLGDDLAAGVGDEALAPELDSVAAYRRFETDAIRHRDIAAVRNGMCALDGFP